MWESSNLKVENENGRIWLGWWIMVGNRDKSCDPRGQQKRKGRAHDCPFKKRYLCLPDTVNCQIHFSFFIVNQNAIYN